MLRGLLLAFHVVLAVMIVILVLLQRGKGADAGAGFGAGASGTVFGARGTATLFSKLTAVFAALFFGTSLTLAYLGTKTSSEPTSVLERAAEGAAKLPAGGAATQVATGVPATSAPAPAASSAPAAPGAPAKKP